MAKGGSFSFGDMKKLQKQLEKMQQKQAAAFAEACAKELAARLLALVIKRTPVGDYAHEVEVMAKRNSKYHKKGDVYKKRINPSGKMGDTLRRGWTTENDRSAMYAALFKGKTENVRDYVNNLQIEKRDNEYVITIENPVEYASYVEYGHRTANGRGWVPGHFMLTISEQEIQKIAPGLLQAKIRQFLGECFK